MDKYRRALADETCYDHVAQAASEAHGAPLVDCILQNREELILLCEWIEAHEIRKYLEIGIWTGRLLSALHRIFDFELVAACDVLEAPNKFGLPISTPPDLILFTGSSHSPEYAEWRQSLGPIDFVFIDGDHEYEAVRRDFEINRELGARFLGFHDITGRDRWTRGVGKFWSELRVSGEGRTWEIVEPHIELGLPESTMGIGIWSEA